MDTARRWSDRRVDDLALATSTVECRSFEHVFLDRALVAIGGLVVLEPLGEFYPAEDYHQDYYTKNPVRYKFYVTGCGRYARLDELWGKLRK